MDLAKAAALLRSEDAAGLLLAALTGSVEGEVPGFTTRLTTWQYRPGAEVSAGFEVSYSTDSGDVVDHLFVTTADVAAPARVSRDGLEFSVWRHPGDPLLPGLAPACDPPTVLGWLGRSAQPAAFDLTLLGYRPLRRAVLRATADDEVTFVKVLRPQRADRLVQRQDLLAEAGLTPAVLARPAPGVILTPAAAGRPLAALLADEDGQVPEPEALVDLLDRLPSGLASLERRPAWAERLDFHGATAAERLPQHANRVTELATRLRRVLATAPVGPVVPTHGDFYEANILADGDRLSLIDLDASGPGLREDDLACLLAHLAVLPGLSPAHYAHLPALVERWTADFAARVNPDALSARVAAVLMTLIAGGDDNQAEHRLQLAEDWAARAG